MGEASSYISTQMKMLEETEYYEIHKLFEKAKGNAKSNSHLHTLLVNIF